MYFLCFTLQPDISGLFTDRTSCSVKSNDLPDAREMKWPFHLVSYLWTSTVCDVELMVCSAAWKKLHHETEAVVCQCHRVDSRSRNFLSSGAEKFCLRPTAWPPKCQRHASQANLWSKICAVRVRINHVMDWKRLQNLFSTTHCKTLLRGCSRLWPLTGISR